MNHEELELYIHIYIYIDGSPCYVSYHVSYEHIILMIHFFVFSAYG